MSPTLPSLPTLHLQGKVDEFDTNYIFNINVRLIGLLLYDPLLTSSPYGALLIRPFPATLLLHMASLPTESDATRASTLATSPSTRRIHVEFSLARAACRGRRHGIC